MLYASALCDSERVSMSLLRFAYPGKNLQQRRLHQDAHERNPPFAELNT